MNSRAGPHFDKQIAKSGDLPDLRPEVHRLEDHLSLQGAFFGDLVVIVFFIVQALDGALTYLGLHTFGPGIEANPLISSAVAATSAGAGVAIAKGVAVGLGMVLHLRRVHVIVAALTVFYIAVAILPWALLFLQS